MDLHISNVGINVSHYGISSLIPVDCKIQDSYYLKPNCKSLILGLFLGKKSPVYHVSPLNDIMNDIMHEPFIPS